MSTDVIGSRYRLGSVVTCTPEATTWDTRDTWLDERVLVVTPEPGCDERFAALAGAVLDRSSSHLVGVYDIGATTDDFVVFGVPAATLSDEQAPREEEDVLLAGRALGDALEALHERGIVHGDLHPGSVVVAGSGGAALSPWPLAPRPHNWSGPGGFGTDPDEPRDISTRDDVRALGAVLLGALAGPPLLSSEQVASIERELAGRAPNAVTIAGRALTPPAVAATPWQPRSATTVPPCWRAGRWRPRSPICRRLPAPPRLLPAPRPRRQKAVAPPWCWRRRVPHCLPASGSPVRSAPARTRRVARSRTRPAVPFAPPCHVARVRTAPPVGRRRRGPWQRSRVDSPIAPSRWRPRELRVRPQPSPPRRRRRAQPRPPAWAVDDDDVTPEHDDIEQPEHHHDGTAGYDHHCTDDDNDGVPEYDDIDVFQRGASRAEQRD